MSDLLLFFRVRSYQFIFNINANDLTRLFLSARTYARANAKRKRQQKNSQPNAIERQVSFETAENAYQTQFVVPFVVDRLLFKYSQLSDWVLTIS